MQRNCCNATNGACKLQFISKKKTDRCNVTYCIVCQYVPQFVWYLLNSDKCQVWQIVLPLCRELAGCNIVLYLTHYNDSRLLAVCNIVLYLTRYNDSGLFAVCNIVLYLTRYNDSRLFAMCNIVSYLAHYNDSRLLAVCNIVLYLTNYTNSWDLAECNVVLYLTHHKIVDMSPIDFVVIQRELGQLKPL